LHDDRAIVQRGAGMEDSQQQVARQIGIQADAAFDEGTQADVPLDDDERAGLGSCEAAVTAIRISGVDSGRR
jgi:hypothetical protein